MVERTLADEITLIVDSRIAELPSNLECIISKVYENGFVDVNTENGVIEYVDCIGSAELNKKGLVLFLDTNFENAIVFCESSGGGGDLSNYYTKIEINTMLSSYVTIEFANTNYATKSHNHKKDDITDFPNIPSKTSDLLNDGSSGSDSYIGSNYLTNNYYNKLEINNQMLNKQDAGDCITSIMLIPKSQDNTGAIRLFYGDE